MITTNYLRMILGKNKYNFSISAALLLSLLACTSKETDKPATDSIPIILRKDSSTGEKEITKRNAPIINITDSVAPRQNILYIKDSASTSLRLSEKLANAYSVKLPAVIKQNKLKVLGPPIARYRVRHRLQFAPLPEAGRSDRRSQIRRELYAIRPYAEATRPRDL